MNNQNFNLQMEKIIEQIESLSKKKKLLLHACCAPCSSACIERLKDFFDLTIYFYNPNMDSKEEFSLRASQQKTLCQKFNVDCVIEEYNQMEFLDAILGLENCLEGGNRCTKCFELRLLKTANFAKLNGFDYFSTTLTISPLKNAKLINQIGIEIEQKTGAKFLPSDFKKKGGYLRSIELSKEHNLYRQNYCGCEFSKNK